MNLIYYFLSFISGAGVTLQAGVNNRLKSGLGDPILTSLVSFIVGTMGLAAAFVINIISGAQTVPGTGTMGRTSWWMWMGGLLGAFYIFSSIFSVSKIGFASMFSLVVAGQIILAVIFDHFGIMGNQVHLINPARALGVLVLIAGVYIIQTH
ncbi:MAG: DMT family transporter [Bacillota bacterium]|nr:DMT family transporter [Bacillota bacterium]